MVRVAQRFGTEVSRGVAMPRILVVEDSRTQAEEVRLILESEGVAVDGARDGTVSLARLGAGGVDLLLTDVVLSDIGLPGCDGYEVARRLRRVPGLKEALLVALTGYGSDEDRRRSREAGFDHHLVKPADP